MSELPQNHLMQIAQPYLLFLGEVTAALDAKTGFGLAHWRPEACAAQWRLPGGSVDLGLPDMTPAQAAAAGVRTMVIGIAPFGGGIGPAWRNAIVQALEAGLDVASGMHTRLGSVPEIAAAAARHGRTLFDVRHSNQSFPVGSGRKRPGKRLLTVGTDCAVGKKYTALSIARELTTRGMAATFRATGQTGILIAGGGVAIDAVVADFISGAAEWLSPDNAPEHWDVIEGQGSLFHPAYAGVSMGLLHGSQPDAIVLCHEAGRSHVDGYPDYPLPPLAEAIAFNLQVGRRTNARVACAGISVNTSALPAAERRALLATLEREHSLPCFDPVAGGAGALVEHLRAFFIAK